MKKILIFLITILIILLSYIGYKSFNIYNYVKENNNITIGSNITITNDKKVSTDNIGKLSFRLKNYTTDNNKYILTNDKYITINEQLGILKNICREDKRLLYIDYIDIMSKNNIKSEVELLNYYSEHKNDTINVLTPLKKVKGIYLSSIFISKLKLNGEINILSGLDGFKNKNKVYLFYQGNMYTLEFTDNYTEKEIIEVLNTCVFN